MNKWCYTHTHMHSIYWAKNTLVSQSVQFSLQCQFLLFCDMQRTVAL